MNILDIKPASYNPRKISDRQLEMLAKSMAEFGDLSGFVLNTKTGNLVGGHQRLKNIPQDAIIKKEKLENISRTGTVAEGYIIADGERWSYREVEWDLYKEKMANIAANKHGGSFDDEKLSLLLSEINSMPEVDFDLTGFESYELDKLLGSLVEEEDNIIPEIDNENVTTKTGELFLLGDHKLLCGDSTKIEDIERLMHGKKADMVFTDPPYGVSYDGGHANDKRRDKLIGDESDSLYAPACVSAFEATKSGAAFYLWHAGVKGFKAAAAAAAAGWEIRSELIWNKNLAQFGAIGAQYKQKHEPFYYCFKKGKAPQWNGPNNEVTVWDCVRNSKNEFHPTQKPVELATRAMANSSKKGDIVLDLFLGSGSTLIACEKTGRICYGIEIDPYYCDVIIKRWEDYTSGKAIKC